MSKFTLLLSCLLLVTTALLLGIDARFSSLESLSFNQLSVTNFFIFRLLSFHDGEFVFLDNLHSCLFESLKAENVEHGLDLFVKVKELGVSVIDLGRFTVVLSRHLRLEEGHRGSIEIELCSDAHFLSGRLISEVLNIFISLHEEMRTAMYGLWGWDVTVGVDRHDSFNSL